MWQLVYWFIQRHMQTHTDKAQTRTHIFFLCWAIPSTHTHIHTHTHTFIHTYTPHTHTYYKCERPLAFLLFTLFVCNNSCNINTSASIYSNSEISFLPSTYFWIFNSEKNQCLFCKGHWLSYYLSLVKCEIKGKRRHIIVVISLFQQHT